MSNYAGAVCGGSPFPLDEQYAFGIYSSCDCGACWYAERMGAWLVPEDWERLRARMMPDNWGRDRTRAELRVANDRLVSQREADVRCECCGQDLMQPPEPEVTGNG